MNFIKQWILIVMSLFAISANGQEKKYKRALDSLHYYIQFAEAKEYNRLQLLTYYQPLCYNSMAEIIDSSVYLKMAYNYKTKIILTDKDVVYMIDFKKTDTSFFKIYRIWIRIKDPKDNIKFQNSYSSRLFNGKIGGIPIEEIKLAISNKGLNRELLSDKEKLFYTEKIIFYLNECSMYAKRVKNKKREIWTPLNY